MARTTVPSSTRSAVDESSTMAVDEKRTCPPRPMVRRTITLLLRRRSVHAEICTTALSVIARAAPASSKMVLCAVKAAAPRTSTMAATSQSESDGWGGSPSNKRRDRATGSALVSVQLLTSSVPPSRRMECTLSRTPVRCTGGAPTRSVRLAMIRALSEAVIHSSEKRCAASKTAVRLCSPERASATGPYAWSAERAAASESPGPTLS